MSLTLSSINSNQALRQARALVGGMSPRQRLIVGGGVLAVVVGMLLFVHLMAKPGYSLLYAALQPADAQQVTTNLGSLGIPYDLSADGASISVPSDQLDHARLELAARGLPHSGQLGFELFDKTNWSGSDFAEQVNYQRALEGELERTIETIHDVQSARVHITMAHDSLFTAEEREAKAAVLLTLRDGTLDPSMVTAIQHLVASAVDHLSPQNVAILDANGEMSLAGSSGAQGQTQLEGALSAKILATLDPIVGAQHVRANVTVEYDPTSADNTQETYDPNSSAVLTSERTSVGGAATPIPAGVPGTSSNLPKAQAAGTSFNAQLGLSSSGGQQSDSQTFAVSRSVNHVIRPAGTIQRITAAVVVDDAVQSVNQHGHVATVRRPRSPEELQQIQSLVAAAIGINPARGDVLTVSNLAFAAPLVTPAAPAPTSPGWLNLDRFPPTTRWMALGGGALCVLLLCGLLLWRPMRRSHAPVSPAQLSAAPEALATNDAGAGSDTHHDFLNMKELLAADPEETPPEVRQVLQLKDRLADRVRREPAIASRLVQGWMNKHREERT